MCDIGIQDRNCLGGRDATRRDTRFLGAGHVPVLALRTGYSSVFMLYVWSDDACVTGALSRAYVTCVFACFFNYKH